MSDFKHPLGNTKIRFLKSLSKIVSYLSTFLLSLFFKINKKNSELIISSSFYAPWKDDRKFADLYPKIKNYTLLDTKRLYTLWQASNMLKNYKGEILDIGCLKGGAGMMMAKNNILGNTFLIDTFSGLVESENLHRKEHFVFKNVQDILNKVRRLNLKKTIVLKGIFPVDFQKKFKNKKFKLCHIDVNTFKSTSQSFNFVKDKIIKNGIIVFDDYGIYSVFGVKKFVDNIMKKDKNFIFINNYMGQCILIKK
tara:strand:- start:212 stop:967 length:756 start_codon:yes stop_codon:yes gene_type:complete